MRRRRKPFPRSLLLPYNQIDMWLLRPLSYESLSDQKQKIHLAHRVSNLSILTCGIAKDEAGSPHPLGGLPDCESGEVATKSQQDESGVLCHIYFHAPSADISIGIHKLYSFDDQLQVPHIPNKITQWKLAENLDACRWLYNRFSKT